MEHTAEAELEKLFFSCEEFKDKDFRRRLSSREIGPRRRQRRASPRLGGMRGHAAPALFLDAATAWRNAEETKNKKMERQGSPTTAAFSASSARWPKRRLLLLPAICFLRPHFGNRGELGVRQESDARAAFTAKDDTDIWNRGGVPLCFLFCSCIPPKRRKSPSVCP